MGHTLLLAALVTGAIAAAPADEEAAAGLTDLVKLRLDLADRSCVVVAPGSGEMDEAVGNLKHVLEEAAGSAPQVVDGTVEPSTLGPGPMILLGNMMDNPAIKRLYRAGAPRRSSRRRAAGDRHGRRESAFASTGLRPKRLFQTLL